MDNVVLKAAVMKIDSAISDISELRTVCDDSDIKSELNYISSLCVAIQSKLMSFATEDIDTIVLDLNEVLSLESVMSNFYDEDEDVESVSLQE